MPHTALGQMLGGAASAAAEASRRSVPIDRVFEERSERVGSRRNFLRAVTGATIGMLGAPLLWAAKSSGSSVRVAIVGGGLAGLTCGYRLMQAGINATVYEANNRLGGRCWTRRGDFTQGQIAEHGGELIDQGHTRLRHLAQELRLPLDNLLAAEPNGTDPFYCFDGSSYTYAEAVADLKAIWQKLHRDLVDAGFPTLYNQSTPRGVQLDHMSISDWINESVSGGINSRLGKLLDIAYNIEYGAECARQSALNLVYLLGYNSPGQFSIFGASNEKYHLRGGNDQIAAALALELGSRIVTGTAMIAVKRNPVGNFTLTFQNGQSTFGVTADKVIFALPFSILRDVVDLTQAGFSPLKMIAINELAMGTNSKLHLQFVRRHWNELGNTGDTYADTGYQNTWEVTRAQAGTPGILVDYTGGDAGNSFGSGTPASRAAQFLTQIEPVLPGLTAAWNGKATVDYWVGNPLTRGSYSYWQIGQYTRFAGIEGAQEGNAYFCGEHTSIEAQGYLEGAVETGQRAAAEVINDLTR
jgi:monoamine oxidase